VSYDASLARRTCDACLQLGILTMEEVAELGKSNSDSHRRNADGGINHYSAHTSRSGSPQPPHSASISPRTPSNRAHERYTSHTQPSQIPQPAVNFPPIINQTTYPGPCYSNSPTPALSSPLSPPPHPNIPYGMMQHPQSQVISYPPAPHYYNATPMANPFPNTVHRSTTPMYLTNPQQQSMPLYYASSTPVPSTTNAPVYIPQQPASQLPHSSSIPAVFTTQQSPPISSTSYYNYPTQSFQHYNNQLPPMPQQMQQYDDNTSSTHNNIFPPPYYNP
jgi:hypothetical protein